MITAQRWVVLLAVVQAATILIDGNDKCDKLDDLEYELFATKTSYNDARMHLRRLLEDKADGQELPNSFDDDRLDKTHEELVEEDGCQPLVFYLFARHSARFPDVGDIGKFNKDLTELVAKIDSTPEPCRRRRSEFLRWKPKMKIQHDNLITDLGGRETRDIGVRFKRLYPDFFNASKADIVIGVTDRLRAAQTAAEFLREVDGLKIHDCDPRTTPTNDLDHQGYDVDKVINAACYKHLIAKYKKPFLAFHKQCEKISGVEKIDDPRIDRVRDPLILKRIANRVAQKLGLNNDGPNPPVSLEVLDSIYNMCRFENALDGDSIWCDVFERRDIEALEYMEDVATYIRHGYGPKANTRQACPLVGDLLEAISEAMEPGFKGRKQAHFHFSHAGPMKKLLGAFHMFRDDESFSEKCIREFERDLRVPKKRSWRTSVIVPFSGNMGWVLYRCQRSKNKPVKFKVLAMLNEHPVKLGGCDDFACDSKQFFGTYDNMRNCDLNEVCRPRKD